MEYNLAESGDCPLLELCTSDHESTVQHLRNSKELLEHDLDDPAQLEMVSCPLALQTTLRHNNERNSSLLQDVVAGPISHGQQLTRSCGGGCTHESSLLPRRRLSPGWCSSYTQTSQDILISLGKFEDAPLGINGLPCSGALPTDVDRNRQDWNTGRQLDSSFTNSLEGVASPKSNATSENRPIDANMSGNADHSVLLHPYDRYAVNRDRQRDEPAQISVETCRYTCSTSGSAAEVEPCSFRKSGSSLLSPGTSWEQLGSLSRDDFAVAGKAFQSRLQPELGLECCIVGLTDREPVFNSHRVAMEYLSPSPSVVAGSIFLAPDVHVMDSQSHSYAACQDFSRLQGPLGEEMQAGFGRSSRGSALLCTGFEPGVIPQVEQKSESGTEMTAKATSSSRRGSKSTKRRRTRASGDSESQHQRITHIVVERNRRKQMNQHLAALKALMPTSYVQKVWPDVVQFCAVQNVFSWLFLEEILTGLLLDVAGAGTQKKRGPRIRSCQSVRGNSDSRVSEYITNRVGSNPVTYEAQKHTGVMKSEDSDQASIIGGAVEFVKELEMLLDSLQSTVKRRTYAHAPDQSKAPAPLVELGASSSSQLLQPPEGCYMQHRNTFAPVQQVSSELDELGNHGRGITMKHLAHSIIPEQKAESTSAAATIEVKTVGNNAIVNIMTPWRPKQLVQVIVAIESLLLNILHTNVTTYKDIVLYTFNVQTRPNTELLVEQIVAVLQRTFNLLHYIQI